MIIRLFDYFITFSFAGWIYESIYCTVKTAHWQNRGFLYGPVCPIYGIGGTAGLVFFFSGWFPLSSSTSPWIIFLGVAAGSAVLEYVTSFLLEKLFHARWWDYSHVPLNLNGRISLPTTAGFGLAGMVIVRYLLPVIVRWIDAARTHISITETAYEAAALVFMAFFAADLALTVAGLTDLIRKLDAAEEEFNDIMAEKYAAIGERQILAGEKIREIRKHTSERLVAMTAGLTARQKNLLNNISRHSSETRTALIENIRGRINSLPRLSAQKPEQQKSAGPKNADGESKNNEI